MTNKFTIISEDCGRWFDDWIIKDGKKEVGVYADVVEIPAEIVGTLLSALRDRRKLTPEEAHFLLCFAEYANKALPKKRKRKE